MRHINERQTRNGAERSCYTLGGIVKYDFLYDEGTQNPLIMHITLICLIRCRSCVSICRLSPAMTESPDLGAMATEKFQVE